MNEKTNTSVEGNINRMSNIKCKYNLQLWSNTSQDVNSNVKKFLEDSECSKVFVGNTFPLNSCAHCVK